MPSLEQAKQYLDQLDLSYIKKKMCAEHYPMPRWQSELADVGEKLYKRYLWLLVKYPDQHLVPTRDIDEFWHNHILYTQRYTEDCEALFGRYIHHHPSDPDDNEDMTNITKQFQLTQKLYQQEFGENLQILKRYQQFPRGTAEKITASHPS